jgi:glycosyltransferase involved in cell wall biosynthesis
MNIIHIIPSLRKGGAERLVLDICQELVVKKDVRVMLVTFSNENQYPEVISNIPWEVAEVSINLSLWKPNKINVSSLQKIIDEFKPDVIHSHLFYAEIVSRFCDYQSAKWFSHGHDNMLQFKNLSIKTLINKDRITNFYEKQLLFDEYSKKGNHFVAISNNSFEFLQKTVNKYPVTLLHNAINYNRFYKKKESSNGKKLVLTNVGSLVNKKNQAFLIDVAYALKEKEIDLELHLLGDGPNLLGLQNRVGSLGLRDVVYLYGNVSNVEEYYWKSDVYVHSATYEPLGLVLLEAMAAGLPVVTLDGFGNRDLIEQGKNGVMVFEPDVELFTQSILDLWKNKLKYIEMSCYAQKYASLFHIKEYTNKLLALYQS